MSDLENPADPTGDAEPDERDAVVTQRATIRRAPKLGVFLVVGAVVGAFLTLILTSAFPVDPEIGFAATFGYFCLFGVPFGVAVGALIGLAFDRRSTRRAREVTVERDHVE